jgi:hypothetical protein
VGFTTTPVSVPVDDCSSALIVQLQDGSGQASKATADTTIALAVDNPLVTFHSDSTCATAITSVSVPKDGETATFFVKGLSAGAGTLTATVDKLKAGTQAVTVTVPVYSVADLCRDLPGAVCAYYVRCGRAQDEASCVDVLLNRAGALADCGRDQSAAVKDGRLTQDPIHSRRCVAALRSTYVCSRDDVVTANADCAATFTGTVALSQTCYVDEECGDAAWCTGTGTSCPGQCLARQVASTSASRDRQCNAGLYVYNGVCVAPVSANGACGPVLPSVSRQRCVSGYSCDANNVCSALKAEGQTCSGEVDCSGVLVCSNGTCAKAGAIGDTCNIGILGQPNIPCRSDLYCDVNAIGTPGVCKVLEPAGNPCFLTTQCKPGAWCQGAVLVGIPAKGTCQAQKGATNTCSANEQCTPGLFCDGSGHCVDRKALGTACLPSLANECNGDSLQCASGLCCQAAQCKPAACHDPTP